MEKTALPQRDVLFIERKRILPLFPSCIGVVTSETGAVIHDIRTVVGRRYPLEIIISPTSVQGEGAHREIACAITASREGSMSSLLPVAGEVSRTFSLLTNPDVVRAIVACPVPVVSAIGHEVDVT